MTPTMTLAEITSIENERALFKSVLLSGDGLYVLAWLANECGGWSMVPSAVPELAALWNRLLHKCGIVHTRNLLEIVKALALAANDNDLMAERMKHAVPLETDPSA